MIAVTEALQLLKKHTLQATTSKLPILKAINHIAAEEIVAPINVPSFDNSAMDGYCFRFEDYESEEPLIVKKVVPAGETKLPTLHKGEAFRIFTGAPIPPNADTVVMQEICELTGNTLTFTKPIVKGSNIREKGTQTKKGEVILQKHQEINAGIIGYLATFGISELPVYNKPKIGIISTGKELVTAGSPLQEGQIYDSNSVALEASLSEIGITPSFSIKVGDQQDELEKIIQQNISKADIVILTGGISVGDYDFVKPALEQLGTEEIFYKVKQKPGKPLFFGKLDKKAIFALPGNPAAVMSCFHVYVKPFIKNSAKHTALAANTLPLKNDYFKKGSLTHFVKAHISNDEIEILSKQLSYQMDAFTKANCIVKLPEHKQEFKKGDLLEVVAL